mmetsp:Transcript_25684/g.59205  ORF Transcript_25684/g.59205 Transcript_25684/m.59205 type:complete len:269 (-) Transcript_25684:101-907(-)
MQRHTRRMGTEEYQKKMQYMSLNDDLPQVIQRCSMSSGVAIRHAVPSDATDLFALHAAFTLEMNSHWERASRLSQSSVEDLESLLTSEPGTVLVLSKSLDRQEELLGFVYSYAESVSGKSMRYIAEVYVSPDVRGFGLSELLMAAGLAEPGPDAAYLMVADRNTSAVNLYKKLGFEVSNKPSKDAIHNLVLELQSISSQTFEIEKILLRRLDQTRRTRRRAPEIPRSEISASAIQASVALKIEEKSMFSPRRTRSNTRKFGSDLSNIR